MKHKKLKTLKPSHHRGGPDYGRDSRPSHSPDTTSGLVGTLDLGVEVALGGA